MKSRRWISFGAVRKVWLRLSMLAIEFRVISSSHLCHLYILSHKDAAPLRSIFYFPDSPKPN